MSISTRRILLLALIGLALMVSAIHSTHATRTDGARSASAHAVLR